MDDKGYMRMALEEAEIALREGNWPIGCVIELGGRVIARNHNRVYTLKSWMAHAETLTLERAQKVLWENKRQATLYTTYEPCPMCFGAVVLSRIKRVVSGVDLDNSGAMYLMGHLPVLFKTGHLKIDNFTTGVLADECTRVFMASEHARQLGEEGLLRKVSL